MPLPCSRRRRETRARSRAAWSGAGRAPPTCTRRRTTRSAAGYARSSSGGGWGGRRLARRKRDGGQGFAHPGWGRGGKQGGAASSGCTTGRTAGLPRFSQPRFVRAAFFVPRAMCAVARKRATDADGCGPPARVDSPRERAPRPGAHRGPGGARARGPPPRRRRRPRWRARGDGAPRGAAAPPHGGAHAHAHP